MQSRTVRSDTLWNIAGSSLPLLVALFSIPFLVRQFGADGFGLVALMWALVGYFGLFDLGVGRALTYELSKEGVTPTEKTNILRSGLVIASLMGVLGAAIIAGILSPNAYKWFKVKVLTPSEVELSFLVVSIAIVPSTITSSIRGAMEGVGKFAESNALKILIGIITFGAPALAVLVAHVNILLWSAISLVFCRMIIMLIAVLWIGGTLFANRGVKKFEGKRIISYGIWVTVSGIISPLMVYGDRFFVTAAVGAALLQYYAIPQEGMQKLLILPAAFAGALMPRFVQGITRSNFKEGYKRHQGKVTIGMLFVSLIAIVGVPLFLSVWISREFAEASFYVVVALSIGVFFNSLAQMPYTYLNAAGYPRLVAFNHIVELMGYIPLIYILSHNFGVVGAAVAWSFRAFVDWALLSLWAKRLMARLV